MAETKQTPEQQLGLVEDLRLWMDESTLVWMVFQALHTVEEDQERWLGARQLPPGLPRVYLTVLTYSYAIGLYRSDDIERRIEVDPQLLYLAAKTSPVANQLRHFRRINRVFLQPSLSRLLQRAWEYHTHSGPNPPPDTGHDIQVLCEWAAERRIDEAVLADTMSLDN